MKLFNFRKNKTANNQSQLPEEVKTFTQAEQRERTGLAWVVGVVSLIVMILVLSLLFFTGRWAYNKLTDSGNTTESTTQTTDETKESDKQETPTSKPNKDDSQSAPDTPIAPEPDTEQTTPRTGPSDAEDLPRTGPLLDL